MGPGYAGDGFFVNPNGRGSGWSQIGQQMEQHAIVFREEGKAVGLFHLLLTRQFKRIRQIDPGISPWLPCFSGTRRPTGSVASCGLP
jgi:hypothetical protein